MAEVIVTVPVGKYIITGDRYAIEKMVNEGYQRARKVLCSSKH